MRNKNLKLAVLALASTALISQSASAISVDFNLTDPDAVYDFGLGGAYAWQYSYDVGGINLDVTGFSYGYGSIWQSPVGNWESRSTEYGLGVEYSNSPNHAIDNYRADYDMLLLSFDQAVSLDSISAGWRYSDNGTYSDASIMAYGGDGAFDPFYGQVWSDLLDDEWEGVGHYRIDSLNSPEAVNGSGLMSQYWLIGAYNETLDLNYESGVSSLSARNDFWKLNGVSVSVNPVPLPGSLVLFGSALMIFGSLRRKKSKA